MSETFNTTLGNNNEYSTNFILGTNEPVSAIAKAYFDDMFFLGTVEG